MFTRDSAIISHNIKTPLTSISRAVGNILQLTYGQLVKSLFSNGEQGFFYDPNDLSTMFQDAVGTVPVTSVGQPVGLMLDKSKGLVLGTELASVTTTTIGNEVAGTDYKLKKIADLVVDRWYMFSMTVAEYTGTLDVGVTLTTFPLLTYSNLSRISNGVIRFISKAGTNAFNIYRRVSNSAVFTNISVKEIRGNHAYQTVSASRPILQRNATTGAYYLAFDGVDDFLKTNNIDFTATDKISLFAGVKSLNANTLYPTIAMFTPNPSWFNNNGTFVLAQSKTPSSYNLGSRGTVTASVTASSTFPTPNSSVLTMTTRISTPLLALRVNSVLAASISNNQGSGNYGNYPLFIGRDGESGSYIFSGHIYSLVGIGRLATDAETIALEKAIAKNTGVTLNV